MLVKLGNHNLKSYDSINSEQKEKNILLSISGGYDSTYLLIKNLKNGNIVYPVYTFVSCINPVKQLIEYDIIKKLICKLQKKYDNIYDLNVNQINIDCPKNLYSNQPILWLQALFKEVKDKPFIDEVHIGYISSDMAVSLIKEIKSLWKCLFSFSHPAYFIPKLKFPLINLTKGKIIENLIAFDEEIYKNCWTCELPIMVKKKKIDKDSIEIIVASCGNCLPCEHIQDTIDDSKNNRQVYKFIFNTKYFINDINLRIKKIVKDVIISKIPVNYLTIEKQS